MAVIMDGNRRWAVRHSRTETDAYQTGALRVHDLMTWCEEAGIAFVTVWALSQDNLHRGTAAVDGIVQAVRDGVREMAATRRWCIRFIGALDQLPPQQATALRALAHQTRDIRGVTLNVALAYCGRSDIVDAVRALVEQKTGPACDGAVTEDRLTQHLSTAGQPDIDLVIRTSGEQRLSGFMPWQTAEAELYFTSTPWPDFDRADFEKALQWYADRDLRFGR
ncbi:polyprenyl diphosphate synthase [Streptomyces sp. CB02923]|uniref:polyprenyl diphosphate synthase n=1 Tax=Streptomyces sp. CB02923 TaxID=1718985 RepID=UPI0018FFC400|nr:polyprenyl diphosphate synthase [Streptomyces sp. CB02923]